MNVVPKCHVHAPEMIAHAKGQIVTTQSAVTLSVLLLKAKVEMNVVQTSDVMTLFSTLFVKTNSVKRSLDLVITNV